MNIYLPLQQYCDALTGAPENMLFNNAHNLSRKADEGFKEARIKVH